MSNTTIDKYFVKALECAGRRASRIRFPLCDQTIRDHRLCPAGLVGDRLELHDRTHTITSVEIQRLHAVTGKALEREDLPWDLDEARPWVDPVLRGYIKHWKEAYPEYSWEENPWVWVVDFK